MLNAVVLDTTIASMMLNQNPLLALYYVHLLNASWFIRFQTVAEMRFGALNEGKLGHSASTAVGTIPSAVPGHHSYRPTRDALGGSQA